MSVLDKWLKRKKSGNFKRHRKANYLKLLNNSLKSDNNNMNSHREKSIILSSALSSLTNNVISQNRSVSDEEDHNVAVQEEQWARNNWLVELDESNNDVNQENDDIFFTNLRRWSIDFKIKHNALKQLFRLLKQRLPTLALPIDPRTFLQTPATVLILNIGEHGQYWHQGLKFTLERVLLTSVKNLTTVSLSINIDGLPLYRSSKDEFWPILYNIHELPHIPPQVVGVYCGKQKPSDLNAFLTPLVDDLKEVLEQGICFKDSTVSVRIRCFICDSPARAFVKGVANFNGQHGCQRCTTVGEYSYISHCNYFARTNAEKRTDANFRLKIYGSHHKQDSPLLQLPVDMIQDFPVADSLHLLDLGVMKRCLIGWRDGNLGTYRTKWSYKEIECISKYLENCKLPSEIHRSMRSLDCLAHWKGLEFRTFLYYIGIVLLKHYLPSDAYQHFLLLFCAVTICSSNRYRTCLTLAESLLEHYVEYYRDIYGEDYMTSNIHNLCHLVDDVNRFGILSTFNAYPFESKLYQIKNMIRTGHKPLIQLAKRIGELNVIDAKQHEDTKLPLVKKELLFNNDICGVTHSEKRHFASIQLNGFVLTTEYQNKWFLTMDNTIVNLKFVIQHSENSFSLCGASLKIIGPFFDTPIRSIYLNIYMSNCEENAQQEYALTDVKCKLVPVVNIQDQFTVFIPLLHTI